MIRQVGPPFCRHPNPIRMQRIQLRPKQRQRCPRLKISRCPKAPRLRNQKSQQRRPRLPWIPSQPHSRQFRHNRQLRQLPKHHCRNQRRRRPSRQFQVLPLTMAASIQEWCPAASTSLQRTVRHSTQRTPLLVPTAPRVRQFSCAMHPDRIILNLSIRSRRRQRATTASSDRSAMTFSNKP